MERTIFISVGLTLRRKKEIFWRANEQLYHLMHKIGIRNVLLWITSEGIFLFPLSESFLLMDSKLFSRKFLWRMPVKQSVWMKSCSWSIGISILNKRNITRNAFEQTKTFPFVKKVKSKMWKTVQYFESTHTYTLRIYVLRLKRKWKIKITPWTRCKTTTRN